jgi:hypothetical protein
MPRKKPITRNNYKKPSKNPLSNLNLTPYLEPKQKKEKDKDTLQELKGKYEKILKKNIKKQYKAFRVVFRNHPDLTFIAFCEKKSTAVGRATTYFHESFHPFFSNSEDYTNEMKTGRAYRVQELDKYGLSGLVPIPELLRVLDLSMPCSVCRKHNFSYSDYINNNCYIIEGEGNLNPYTKGYLLCHDCYKKYIDKK